MAPKLHTTAVMHEMNLKWEVGQIRFWIQVIEKNIRNSKMRNGEAEEGLGPSGQEKQVNEIL